MARPKTIETPTVSPEHVGAFREQYDQKRLIVDELKDSYDKAKRDLNDFRNEYAVQTSLCIPPVEFFMKKAQENPPRTCVLWLRAAVITFKQMGVFDQTDAFLVEELIEEIKSINAVAA